MQKRVLWGTVAYVASVTFILGVMYHMLNTFGISTQIYLLSSLILILFSVMFGYIFITSILAPKKKLDENLSQLTKEIVHELNIPLSTIQANSALLKRKMEDEKSLKRLERIEDASLRLDRLYKELVYSIKKEFQPIEKETFDLKKVLEERVAIFKAFERNAFELELSSYKITADKIGFEKMIDNLLMNAMKYSDKEKPIRLKLDDHTLQIIDQGVGMNETELLKIYERYYQADGSKEGEGIGLALVKSYCDSEHIDIQINSQKGIGTSVNLSLENIYG